MEKTFSAINSGEDMVVVLGCDAILFSFQCIKRRAKTLFDTTSLELSFVDDIKQLVRTFISYLNII